MNESQKKEAAAETATFKNEPEAILSHPTAEIKEVLAALSQKLGPCVFVPVRPREKTPAIKGWQSLTIETAKTDEHLERFTNESNVAVLLGEASRGLCTVDCDTDDSAEEFLQANPKLSTCLQTRGFRGRNFWVRIDGPYPEKSSITKLGGKEPVGEWRSNRHLSIVHGTHPKGDSYRTLFDATPAEIRFDEIAWPEGWRAPFIETHEDRLEKEFGPLVFIEKKGVVVNHPSVIARFAAERDILWEPAEKRFYLYDQNTGLWCPQTTDHIKTAVSRFMLRLAVESDEPKLAKIRNNGTLSSLVDLLKGQIESYDPFSKTERGIVHVKNGMIDLRGPEPTLTGFHPDYRSRNQIPFPINDTAECPRFLSDLLAPALPEDDISLLQRWAGAVLLGGNVAQRILLLVGTPGGGKGTLVSVLERIVGEQNICELRTKHLEERFEIARFSGKRLLLGKDVPGDFLEAEGASALKKLSGDDLQTGEAKGSNLGIPIRGNFDICVTCNSRLRVRLEGDAGAWRRRLILISYEKSKPQHRIERFAEKLIAEEGSGILRWMIAGARAHMAELQEHGDFVLSDDQKNRVEGLLNESDSVRFFVERRVRSSPSQSCTTDELVKAYSIFCDDQAWAARSARQVERSLGDLMLEMFGSRIGHGIKREGNTYRGYSGVALC